MDVPEDIRGKARKIAETVRTYRHNASQWEMVRDAAAQALLAERLAQRERDAKIAESEIGYMASVDWDSSAQKIADLIRQS